MTSTRTHCVQLQGRESMYGTEITYFLGLLFCPSRRGEPYITWSWKNWADHLLSCPAFSTLFTRKILKIPLGCRMLRYTLSLSGRELGGKWTVVIPPVFPVLKTPSLSLSLSFFLSSSSKTLAFLHPATNVRPFLLFSVFILPSCRKARREPLLTYHYHHQLLLSHAAYLRPRLPSVY